MNGFAQTLLATLRRMDAEAAPTANGWATGLNWYGGHREPKKKRPRTEVCWSQRLAELLPERGYATRAEVRYPSLPRCKCDNVITLPDGKTLWLENKGAWKDYWIQQRRPIIDRSYLLHPLVSNLDTTKSHTVPLDLQKLSTLAGHHADYVGLLLAGFDRDNAPMLDDVAELVRLAKLDTPPWSSVRDNWRDAQRAGMNVRCWFWWRPT